MVCQCASLRMNKTIVNLNSHPPLVIREFLLHYLLCLQPPFLSSALASTFIESWPFLFCRHRASFLAQARDAPCVSRGKPCFWER